MILVQKESFKFHIISVKSHLKHNNEVEIMQILVVIEIIFHHNKKITLQIYVKKTKI